MSAVATNILALLRKSVCSAYDYEFVAVAVHWAIRLVATAFLQFGFG